MANSPPSGDDQIRIVIADECAVNVNTDQIGFPNRMARPVSPTYG
jgi:hypothetical protein